MIILASASPTRQLMLANAGVIFNSIRPDVDESSLLKENPAWTPTKASLSLAAAKAKDVSRRNPEAIVIGADQVLSFADHIYSKPLDIDGARRQLKELRGQTHQLISSAVCARNGAELWRITCSAHLTMRNISDGFLESYLARNGIKSLASVGAYQIEGLGSQLFDKIDGDYFTILGLPLLPLLEFLRAHGEIET